jgi:DNA-binding response OmpR family regulator
MTNETRQILIVEDSPSLARALRISLRKEGYRADICADALSARRSVAVAAYDLVLLDLGLPDGDGMELLREWREGKPTLPVLVITARDAVDARVQGLDAGACDYLVKPLAIPELLARMRRAWRESRPAGTLLECGHLRLDTARGEAFTAGERVFLSPLELRLLRYLLEHKDRIVSRSMLAADVWEIRSRSTPLDNVIEAGVSRLREKVERPGCPALLHTVRGMGYQLKEPAP